jgi:hypothetical protein
MATWDMIFIYVSFEPSDGDFSFCFSSIEIYSQRAGTSICIGIQQGSKTLILHRRINCKEQGQQDMGLVGGRRWDFDSLPCHHAVVLLVR